MRYHAASTSAFRCAYLGCLSINARIDPGVAKYLLVFLLIVVAAVGLVSYRISPAPFGYDESDYVYAAGFPTLAHWTDSKSMSIVDYVRIGLGRGLDPKQRLALSAAGRTVDDHDEEKDQ